MIADLFFSADSFGSVAGEQALGQVSQLHFSFETGLMALSCLLILSIFAEKIGLRIGIPGSIFLFFTGLLSHVSGFSFERFPLEEVHAIALSVLLFFSGLSFDRSLLKKSRQLNSSVRLAVLGTGFSMIFWLLYLQFGIGFFQSSAGYLIGVEPSIVSLMTVVIVASIAVQDWNAFAFVSGKIKDFESILADIFKVETAISASIAVAVAELAVLFWLKLNPGFEAYQGGDLLSQIFYGACLGSVTGLIFGFMLTLVIRFLVTSSSQLVLAALAFVFAGYVVTFVVVHQGGYLCALVMGVVTSMAYRSSSTEKEINFLSKSLDSVNMASEAILFFVVGLGLDAASFFVHLPIAFYAWTGIILIRPISAFLFFRGTQVPSREKKLLASFSPKGAISMALVVTAPTMLEQTFGLDVSSALTPASFNFMADVVCGAVLISMIFKSLFIPALHKNLTLLES